MTLIKANRARGLGRLFPETSFFDDFLNLDWPSTMNNNGDLAPAANVKEGEKAFELELSVPGYAKKEIHIEVDENRMLCISGEHQEESKVEENNYTRKEFSYGSFSRNFQLPDSVDGTKISAKCKEGVLSIHLPKKEVAIHKKNVKEVKIA